MKTKIIAEIGPNHNGDINLATELINKLADQNIDFVKFQIANPEKVYSKNAFFAKYQKKNVKENSIIEMSKKIQLKKTEHKKIFEYCNKKNIRYSCSAFDLGSLKFIHKNFNLPFFKIPSGEILSLDMLDYIIDTSLPILLSTGTSKLSEIEFAFNYLNKKGKKDITIMHCISSYPAKLTNINMEYMLFLKNHFNVEIGYSDHTIGPQAAIVAASMGASVIEKHVTLNKNLDGPDHKSSMEIEEFLKLVKEIKLINSIRGNSKKSISHNTRDVKKVAMKSLVAKKKLKKNEKLKKSDILFKRPGIGISPKDLEKYLGKKLCKNIDKDTVIFDSDFF